MAKLASCLEFTLAMMIPEDRETLWKMIERPRHQMGAEHFEDSDDYVNFIKEHEGL